MYCTTDDVILITETATAVDVIAALIEVADREIDAHIRAAGLVPPTDTTPDLLRDASANLTAALIINRGRVGLSRPVSLGGDISFSTSPDTEIARHETRAYQYLAAWISAERESQGIPAVLFTVVEGE